MHRQKKKASPLTFILLALSYIRGQQIAKNRQKVQENNEIILVTSKWQWSSKLSPGYCQVLWQYDS